MPEPVVQRYREGEETIAQDHQDVTVIFADIVGLDELSDELPSEESLAILNELVRQFDAAAEDLGVEQVRTLHNGYLASCGLNVPRLDNVRRTVDFALGMQRIIDRFNGETGHDLEHPGRHRHRHGDQRAGRPVEPRLRHVGCRGQPGLPGAERFTEAGHLRDGAGVRAHAGHAAFHPGRRDHRRRGRGADLAAVGASVMTSLFDSSWFYWAIGVAIGLPVGLILLTEWQHMLVRRRQRLARPVSLLRNYLLPLAALLLLLVKATEVSAEATSVRVVATVFGFVVLVMLLSGLNATVFQGAPEGSWRKRMPTIFLDVARFVLIALGLAVIFSYIWGANVGGLFTALGISIGRSGPGVAELRRPDHLRPAVAVRAAVPARRLARHPDGAGAGGRGELAGHPYRHRQRHADHAQLGAGRRVVHQPEPACRRAQDRDHHDVLTG